MPTFENASAIAQQAEGTDGVLTSVQPGDTIETFKWLPEPIWTKTLDTPYYQVIDEQYTVTATGAEFKSQAVNQENNVFELRASVDLTAHANSESANGYPVLADVPVQIRHDGNIGEWHLDFTAAGSCVIIGIRD